MTREVMLVGVVCLHASRGGRKKRLQERRAKSWPRSAVARALRPRTPEDCPEAKRQPGAEEGNMRGRCAP